MKSPSGISQQNHILLKLAKTYPVFTGELAPPNGRYDLLKGVWISEETGAFLSESLDFPRVATKKADVETGEDQKGE